MFYVLANTVQFMEHESRMTPNNKAWARTVPVVFEKGRRDMS